MMWEHDHQTLKYALPGAVGILLGTGAWFSTWDWLTVVLTLFTALFFVIAATNYWRVWSNHKMDLYKEKQTALSVTPLVLLAQNMKQMHPDAVKVLNRFGVRTTWQVKVDANRGTRDWILLDTNVHFGFIEYVLSKSNGALYPKWKLPEGSKKWDPDGLVEDREQHVEFEKWLFARMMVTRAHGDFKPAEFLPPWTPTMIMEVLGLTGDQELFRPDEDVKIGSSVSQSGKKEMADYMNEKLNDLQQTASMQPATK